MPRRGESIYKRKDGRWEARYVCGISANGKKKYGSVYAESYQLVKEKQQARIFSYKYQQSDADLCVEQLVTRWLSHIQDQVKPATYQKYKALCQNHILPHLGSRPLLVMSRTVIEEFARTQKTAGRIRGGGLSSKTVNDILNILNLAFDFAWEEYGIQMPKISFIREEKKEARVLSLEEQKRLTGYLLQDMDVYKFGTLLALYTGIRIGELCALLWEDINEQYLTVSKTLQRIEGDAGETKIIVDSPKSDSSKRIVPLPTFLHPYIVQFRKPGGYVISTSRSPHSEPRAIQQKFQSMVRACDLEQVTFHTLRHTFATRCVESGFDIKTLSEILGHSDVRTTLNRYVHSSFTFKQSNMEKLAFVH